MENMEQEDTPTDPDAFNQHLNPGASQYAARKVISMKVLRWKFVQHKLNRVLGVYNDYEQERKLDLVNRIFSVFL